MIIIKTSSKINSFNQNHYNNIIHSIHLSEIECNDCHHHDWSFHSTYQRYVDFFGLKIRIKITRIICNHCGKTHALLIGDMIPYSCLSFQDIITVLQDDHDYIDSSHLHFLKKKYRSHTPDYFLFCIINKRKNHCIFFST